MTEMRDCDILELPNHPLTELRKSYWVNIIIKYYRRLSQLVIFSSKYNIFQLNKCCKITFVFVNSLRSGGIVLHVLIFCLYFRA